VRSKPESAVYRAENWDCTLSQSGSSGVNFMSLLYCASFLLFLSVSVAAHVWGDHIVSLFFVFLQDLYHSQYFPRSCHKLNETRARKSECVLNLSLRSLEF